MRHFISILYRGILYARIQVRVVKVTQWGMSNFQKNLYKGVRFNVINVTGGGSGSNFQEKSIT